MRRGILVVVALIAFGACGKTSSTSSQAPVKLSGKVNTRGTATATAGTFEVEQDDFYFKPTFIKAQPGMHLTIALHNEGKAQHTFTSSELGTDTVVPSDGKMT